MNLRVTSVRESFANAIKGLAKIVIGTSLLSAVQIAFGQTCPPLPTDPVALNTNAASDIAVDVASEVATDGVGTWMVVWVLLSDPEDDGLDKDIVFSRSLDNGVTWTASAPVHNNAETDVAIDITPQIVADGAGAWVVVWCSNDQFGLNLGHDFDIIFVRSTDDGATWSAPAPVNTNAVFDGRSDFEPSVASDGAGHLVVVWETNNDLEGTIGEDDDILFARSSDNGQTWSAPAPLASTAGSDVVQDSQARVVTDGAGMWVAAWHAGVFGPPGAPNDFDILYVRSTDDGATWSAPIPLNSNAESDGGSDRFPHLSTDGAGNWIAVWRGNEDLGGDIGNDIDIFVAHSSDNAETWSAPAALNSNAAVDDWADFTPRITTDGNGTWVAVWSSWAFLGDDWNVYFSLSTDAGQTWTGRTRLNRSTPSDDDPDYRPSIASDGLSHWVAVWDSRDDLEGTIGDESDILTTRFEIGPQAQVTLCHVPPGNHPNRHTITVSQSAVAAHLAHNDSCGSCGGPGPLDATGNHAMLPGGLGLTDVNVDGRTEPLGLASLLASWGPCPDEGECPADLDADGTVGPRDLVTLLGNWGPCP